MERKNKGYVWEQKEIDYLKEHIDDMPYEDIARKLGISHTTVRLKAVKLGLSRPRYTRTVQWPDEKIAYLKEHFPTETLSDLSSKLNISMPTIRKKAEELGLKRAEGYRPQSFYRRYVNRYKHIATE